MQAIVEISGQQFKVESNTKINVPLLNGKPGDSLKFTNILLTENGDDIKIGTPYLEKGAVSAKIVEHGRDKKILIFHKKRRKGYRKLNGHKQDYTTIEVTNIKVN